MKIKDRQSLFFEKVQKILNGKIFSSINFDLYGFSETKYKCINMFGRTEDIIEIQEGNLVDDMDYACSIENMDDDNLPFTTLISN